MKKIVIMITMLAATAARVNAQPGSQEYTNAILQRVADFNNTLFEKHSDYNLRRAETGTLLSDGNRLYASIERKLYTGNDYFIYVLSDSRVKNIKLNYYTYNSSSHKWDFVKTIDENALTTQSTSLSGDNESALVTPTDDVSYRFEIEANNQGVRGRYLIMLWSKSKTSTSNSTSSAGITGGALSYKVDNFSIAAYDAAKSAYGDWGSNTDYACTFSFNTDQTEITRTLSTGETATFKVGKKYVSDSKQWNIFETTNVDGKDVTICTPTELNKNGYLRMQREMTVSGTTNKYLIDYHIVSTQGSADPINIKVDYFSRAAYDDNKKTYGDWEANVNYSCTFSLNADQSVFTQTLATGEVFTFTVKSKTLSTNKQWDIYQVTGADGKSLTLDYPTSENTNARGYFRVAKTLFVNGKNTDYLIDYHIVK